MLSKLLPIVFLTLGLGAGIGAGMFLAPAPQSQSHGDDTDAGEDQHGEKEASHSDNKDSHDSGGDDHGDDTAHSDTEYVKLNNQFVVPVVQDDRVTAMIVVSLSLETTYGFREEVYAREPKLRDAFLQVMFDHSNMGGFQGAFTKSEMLELLRDALRDAARKELGQDVLNVLIVDIARQDT
ncbi:MAG: flagellar FliL protein [Paracoccaceae bacterium]|jgi:flagellar FliL protein